MGIFDFFKKKQPERQRIKFEELGSWMSEKNNEISKTKENIIKRISERVEVLVSSLEQNKSRLKNVNLDNKKAEEKIKLIVMDNLEKYLINLNSLTKNLEKLDYSNYEQLVSKIDNLLLDFKKRSLMHYEKATILIGDELGNVRDKLSQFSTDLNNIIKENQETIKNNKNIMDIAEEINAIKSTNDLVEECDKKILIYREKVKLEEKEIKDSMDSIENLKKSKGYEDELKENRDLYQIKIDSENKINEIKALIDFKKLSNTFHSDTKKMKIINEFKDNFKDSFTKDKEKILALLRESNLLTSAIEDLTQEVTTLSQLVKEKESSQIHQLFNEISSLEKRINKIQEEINYLNEDIEKEGRKKLKFNESKIIFIDQIKAILISMNLELY